MSETTRTVRCEPLGTLLTLPAKPRRVAILSAGFTEAAWAMGLEKRVAGVSKYCSRFVDTGRRPVVGDYLRIDEAALAAAEPDVIVMTGGVQLGVARKLAKAGWPVFVLPLPDSFAGILENIRRLGALFGEMRAALALTARMEAEAAELRMLAGTRERPMVYAELWFGRHPRMAGGLTFIHDLIELAGGENLWADVAEGYPKLDLPAVEAARPGAILLFSEEDDHPVDTAAWLRERGWAERWDFNLIEANIPRGRNPIHDGPSLLETARWLRGRLMERDFL